MQNMLLAILLVLGMALPVWADGDTTVVSSTTLARHTRTVFNDAGSALTSGSVVIWDSGDTEFDRSGFPYVTTTTTADDVRIAGVLVTGSCLDQSLCEMVDEGPAITVGQDSSDAMADDTLVGTATVAGTIGDYAPAANTCALGRLMEDRNADTGETSAHNNKPMWVLVDVDCQ